MQQAVVAQRKADLAKYFAEFIGTFFLVFTIGCAVHTGSVGAAVSIGMMLMVMIFALGSVSGAHFNPAVTLAVFLTSRPAATGMTVRHTAFYMLFQVIGAMCGGLLYLMLTKEAFLMRPVGAYSLGDSIALEVIYSWALCYVVLNVATMNDIVGSNSYFGLAIGSTVMSAAIAIGPISGCSLNPAVSIGAITAGHFKHGGEALLFWAAYVFAPFAGALVAVAAFQLVRGPELRRGFQPLEDPHMKTRDVKFQAPAPRPVIQSQKSRILRRKESISLDTIDPEILDHDLFCGLRWQAKESLDIDASCVMFSGEGEKVGAVYFANAADNVNRIFHSGDQVTGDTEKGVRRRRGASERESDNEWISFKLSDVSNEVCFLFFVITIYSSGPHSFSEVKDISIRLVDQSDGNKELLTFTKQDIGQGNGLVPAMLFRIGDTWCFKAVDDSYNCPEQATHRDLDPQLKSFCLQTLEDLGAA